MMLNLGIGSKATFVDQTPTPTQFIRNCEEVGLFQDLQNINPFEETFKKAFEAVKAGQPVYSEKSSHSNGADDTLHTPNIFPHITDFPNSSQENMKSKSENIPPEEILVKQELLEEVNVNNKFLSLSNSTKHHKLINQLEKITSLENTNKSENKCANENNNIILNVPEGHIVQFLTQENTQSTCDMIVFKNTDNVYTTLPLSVRDKLKKSLNDKKIGKVYHKVPISKCPSKKLSNTSAQKFSKCSKNSIKVTSKLPNSGNEDKVTIFNLNANNLKKSKKKNDKVQTKESRSEFLARSRAASSRCREKKKLYVLHLEKVNGELSIANQNLQLINISLRKRIQDLHAELLKHKDCSVADKNTEIILTEIVGLFGRKTEEPEPVSQTKLPLKVRKPEKPLKNEKVENLETPQKTDLTEFVVVDSNFFTFDVAEVTLEDKNEENEIPLKDSSKPRDIIVRFNNVGNDFSGKLLPDSLLSSYIEIAEENVKRIYAEHSYFLKKPILDINKRFMNYKMFDGTISSESAIQSENFGNLESVNAELEKSVAFRDITGLNPKVVLEPKTPPPLILLKPFKKRTVHGKQAEKT